MAQVKLSVVIPCYNEEKRFKEGFNHYYSYLEKQKYQWELIFVNDGSSDLTPKLMKNLSKGKSNIKIVSYHKNRGKGYAIVQGVKAAKGQYILFSDIDHSVPIKTIVSFLELFEKGYQVVVGSRRVKGADILIHQHPIREYLGRGFTLLVNLLIYWGIADATCGFKAFSQKAARKIFNKISIYDWAFDAEVLFICKKNNIQLIQVPVSWSDVEGSKVTLIKDIFSSLNGLLKIRFNNLRGKYN